MHASSLNTGDTPGHLLSSLRIVTSAIGSLMMTLESATAKEMIAWKFSSSSKMVSAVIGTENVCED